MIEFNISQSMRAPIAMAVAGILVTAVALSYFHWEANREAREIFDLRADQLGLKIQARLLGAISASRGIRAVVESATGIEEARALNLAGMARSPLAFPGISWIALFSPRQGVNDNGMAGNFSPPQVVTASGDAPDFNAGTAPAWGDALSAFAGAVNRVWRSGNAEMFPPVAGSPINHAVYLSASGSGSPRVLAVALDVQSLIGGDLAEFRARDDRPPIATYAVRLAVAQSGMEKSEEKLLLEVGAEGAFRDEWLARHIVLGSDWLVHDGTSDFEGIRLRIRSAIARSEIQSPDDEVFWWALLMGIVLTAVLCVMAAKIAAERRAALEESRRMGVIARSSEDRFRNLVESTRDWMWEADAEGRFVYSSSAIVSMLGYSPAEIIGKQGREFGFDFDMAGATERLEVAAVHRGGRQVWLQCTCIRFHDAEGRLAGYRGVCADVTSTRNSAERRRALEQELSRADKLGTLDHAMSIVAHELNQPLSAVAGYCGASIRMLREKPESLDEVIASLTAAASQAQVAAAAVRGIRQYISKRAPSIASNSVDEMVSNALSLVSHRLAIGKIRLVRRLQRDLPPVLADGILILQVLLNLLHNAIDAVSDAADPAITVCAEIREDGWIGISVEDNGKGMSDEQLMHCFEPYLSTKPNGLGLGLSISQEIVESHGSMLRLSRNAAGGCTATFSLEADANHEPSRRRGRSGVNLPT